MQLTIDYRAKARECRQRSAEALTPGEKEDWIKLALEWETMESEANPSGALPWAVPSS